MKKNKLWRSGGLAVWQVKRTSTFAKTLTTVYDGLNIVGPQVIDYGESIQLGLKHRGTQPIRFRVSTVISQSDLSNVENRSERVFRHGDFAHQGFKHRGTQPIRFRVSIATSQSDLSNVENRSERVFRHGDFAHQGFKHRETQLITFRVSIATSQSDLSNVENRSERGVIPSTVRRVI